MRRCRNNLLWSLVFLVVVMTITSFFLYAEMWRGSAHGAEALMRNPFFLLSYVWVSVAVFRLARAINPRWYFLLPVMVIFLLIPPAAIAFLPIKASQIYARLKAQ
jgi:amino acid transporter